MSTMTKATIKHIDELVKLRIALLTELGEVRTLEEIQTLEEVTYYYLKHALVDDTYISFIIEDHGQVVSTTGLVFLYRPPSYKNLSGKEAYLLNVYTHPEYRRLGYANILLEQCVQECKAMGIKRIFLHATEQGEPIYTKYGFTPKEHEMELFI